MSRALVAGVTALLACRGTLSPLSNKIDVGREAYVVFVADGEDGRGDLFAAPVAGGTTYQVTFTRVEERLPALAPDGVMLAFARGRDPGDSGAGTVTVFNLLNGAERRIAGATAGPPLALAWSRDGGVLYARTAAGTEQVAAPPATGAWSPVPPDQRARADSAFLVWLGDPPQGVAAPCEAGGLCVRLDDGRLAPLHPTAILPTRWLGDSVVYREGEDWVVRPLAGGTTRVMQWGARVTGVRGLTLFPGRR